MKLDAWLRQEHPLPERLRLVERLSQALNAVHDRGEVLASLDPSRVDLGNDLKCDLSGAGRGSPEPGYSAPERLEGRPPSPEADVYAAGAIAWEALVGRPCGELPAPLGDVAPDLPREIASAVMGCLERSPQWRPKDLTYLAQLAAAHQKSLKRGPGSPPVEPRAPGRRPGAHAPEAAVPQPHAAAARRRSSSWPPPHSASGGSRGRARARRPRPSRARRRRPPAASARTVEPDTRSRAAHHPRRALRRAGRADGAARARAGCADANASTDAHTRAHADPGIPAGSDTDADADAHTDAHAHARARAADRRARAARRRAAGRAPGAGRAGGALAALGPPPRQGPAGPARHRAPPGPPRAGPAAARGAARHHGGAAEVGERQPDDGPPRAGGRGHARRLRHRARRPGRRPDEAALSSPSPSSSAVFHSSSTAVHTREPFVHGLSTAPAPPIHSPSTAFRRRLHTPRTAWPQVLNNLLWKSRPGRRINCMPDASPAPSPGHRVRRLLAFPPRGESDAARLSRLLQAFLALSAAVTAAFLVLAGPALNGACASCSPPPCSRALGALSVLARAGWTRLAAALYLGGLWLFVTLALWLFGGFHGPAATAYTVVALGAALLFGTRGAAAATAVIGASGVFIALAEVRGWLPAPRAPGPTTALFIFLASLLSLVGMALYATAELRGIAIEEAARVRGGACARSSSRRRWRSSSTASSPRAAWSSPARTPPAIASWGSRSARWWAGRSRRRSPASSGPRRPTATGGSAPRAARGRRRSTYRDDRFRGVYEVHAFQTAPGMMAVMFLDDHGAPRGPRRSAAAWRTSSASRRRWRRWAGSPAASPTTSTTCSW